MKTLYVLALLLAAGAVLAQAPQLGADPAFAKAMEEARQRSAQVLQSGGVDPGRPSTASTPAQTAPAAQSAPNVEAAMEAARRRSERLLAQPAKPAAPSYRDVYGLPSGPAPRTPPAIPLELGKGVDPAAIAARFKDMQPTGGPDHELLIFVSTSIPKATLVKLGEQAKTAGGILVMRGVKGGLQQKNALAVMASELQPVAATGVDIQIHPELFTRYNVSAVPTFVLAREVTDCGTDACAARMTSLAGDVSLDFALERFTASPDARLAQLARAKLARLERRP